jgi:hypothetical protein
MIGVGGCIARPSSVLSGWHSYGYAAATRKGFLLSRSISRAWADTVGSRTIGSLVGYNIYIQYYIITATNVPIG